MPIAIYINDTILAQVELFSSARAVVRSLIADGGTDGIRVTFHGEPYNLEI